MAVSSSSPKSFQIEKERQKQAPSVLAGAICSSPQLTSTQSEFCCMLLVRDDVVDAGIKFGSDLETKRPAGERLLNKYSRGIL